MLLAFLLLAHPAPQPPSLLDRAAALQDRGQFSRAEPLYRKAISQLEARLGPRHPDLAEPLNSLASLWFDLGRYRQSEQLATRALDLARAGGNPAQVARLTANLAAAWQALGDLDKAGSLYGEALASLPHPDSAGAGFLHNNIGLMALTVSRLEEARTAIEKARGIWRGTLPASHPVHALSAGNLACVYGRQGRHQAADKLWLEAIALAESSLGPHHYLTGHLYAGRAETLRVLNRKQESKQARQRARAILNGESKALWKNGAIDIRALQSMTPSKRSN